MRENGRQKLLGRAIKRVTKEATIERFELWDVFIPDEIARLNDLGILEILLRS